MSPTEPSKWDDRYQTGDTPWDSGVVSAELIRVLAETPIPPCRAIEFGCGSGINAVYLAQQGFEVTAVDISPTALDLAQQRADSAGVTVNWLQADVCRMGDFDTTFGLIFDRGCYHAVRRFNLGGYLDTLRRASHGGTWLLLLAGNADEVSHEGPPRVHEYEIRADLEGLFSFRTIRPFRFHDTQTDQGPLAWSCLAKRFT